jgi:branched-chain amino acid transport system permease protein
VSLYTERWLMVLGAMFVLIMIFAPEGVVGKARALIARNAERRGGQ